MAEEPESVLHDHHVMTNVMKKMILTKRKRAKNLMFEQLDERVFEAGDHVEERLLGDER